MVSVMRIQDISSSLLTHYEEPDTIYPNIGQCDIYSVDSSSTLQRLNQPPRYWKQLEDLATEEQKTFYVFRKNWLIKTVVPAVNSKKENQAPAQLCEKTYNKPLNV